MRIESLACSVQESYHGGIDVDELLRYGISADQTIDFSSNLLCDGPSPLVYKAVQAAALDRYPDRDCRLLRDAIGQRYVVSPERLLIGNGCSELIHLVAATYIRSEDKVLVVGPTFSEYERASLIAGGAIQHCDAGEESRFAVPVEMIDRTLSQFAPKMVWICNPNNPTGQSVSKNTLVRWIQQYHETVFVIDESYIEFATHTESLIGSGFTNLVVLRSMTKAYGIAGLRLGFAWLPDWLHQAIRDRRIPWTVNSVAQAAGTAAIQDVSYYAEALSRLSQAKQTFMDQMSLQMMTPLPSDTGFFLLRVDQPKRIRDALVAQGMVVRDCQSFGLDHHLRIAVLERSKNDRLTSALARLVCGGAARASAAKFFVGSGASTSRRDDECWDQAFRERLNRLFQLRRDVRRFRVDAIPGGSMERWLEAASLAPSVGLSQPWRFVSVRSDALRAAMITEFELQNAIAASTYDDVTASRYRRLKLAGLREAPEQLAVFVDEDPREGSGLGRSTMPETLDYSVVAAIQNLWLAARAEGVGVGWISILRPEKVVEILNVPSGWRLIAYLCLGYPLISQDDVPELEREGWEQRRPWSDTWHQR